MCNDKKGLRTSLLSFLYSIIILLLLLHPVQGEERQEVTLTVRGADISDVLMMLTEQSGINLVPDHTVQGLVTIDLRDVELQEALKTLTIAYGYQFDQVSPNIYLVSSEGYTPPAEVTYRNGLLSVVAENGDIIEVLNKIAAKSGINLVIDNQVSGMVTANIRDVRLEAGLLTLLQANGFTFSKSNEIYRVFSTGRGMQNNLAISYTDGKLNIDVEQADLGEVLRTISRLSGINMILFSGIREVVDLKLVGIGIKEAIDIILAGTRFTYRQIDGVYLIGEKNINSPASALLTTSRIIPLEYQEAANIPQLLPNNFPAANVKVITEQNAILVTGTQAEIEYLEEYIAKIDQKIPQIVVKALIIELSHNRNENPKIGLGMDYDQETLLFDSLLGQLSYRSILQLPRDFYLEINNLVAQGMATVKASPNITTLNGQQARIDVGTVQYYRVIDTDSEGKDQTKYQSVNAGVTLEVTPWVSSTGEINLKLRPTVSNIGAAVAEGLPQISRREVSTTVRIKDGQTIIIGGLIQDVGSNARTAVPFLGDLPLIGSLFRSTNSDVNQTELIIYITPHVMTEEEEDVGEEMELMLDRVEKVNIGEE